MSKASNKRAKKLDQTDVLDTLVTLGQQSKFAKQADSDLFRLDGSTSTALTPAQLRKSELTQLLFAPKEKSIVDPFAFKKELKKKSTAKHTTLYRHKKNKELRRQERLAGDQQQRQQPTDHSSTTKHATVGPIFEQDVAEESDEDGANVDDAEKQFRRDWATYTNNLTAPLPALRKEHEKILQGLKLAAEYKQKDFDREVYGGPTQRKLSAKALAHSYNTGRHMDYMDMQNVNEDRDIWDEDDVQANVERKSIKPRDLAILEETSEWLIPLADKGVKNRRHHATSKHVTTKQTVVAPSGLSINPVRAEMKALIQVYKRRLRGEKIAQKKVAKALAGHIRVKNVPNPSAKEVERMHRTIYRPVETKVHKLKTRQERNAMKKKAENRYKHAMMLREKRFDASFKKIHLTLEAWRKHQKYLKEKLPKIRAEIAAVKKDQPVKFGRNVYKAPKPELQTHDKLLESQGHLRRTHMSTSLLADAFGALQRTNLIPAIGKSGKRAPKKQVVFKHTRAAGSRVGRIDVDEVMRNATQKALANPKPSIPTKNKKRKLELIKGYNKESGDKVDYGYESDDDIWG